MKKLPLSVAIITFNEEDNIGRTLRSISDIAEEIIVVDSGSDDRTVEIAESFGAKIYSEKWKGHIAQKNSALEKCTSEWIFSIDADEEINDELKSSIIKAIKEHTHNAWSINRKTFYLNKLLKYAWQPDWNLRLVKKSLNPRWGGLDPHDKLIVGTSPQRLKGYVIHYSYKGLHHHFTKTLEYAKTSAESYYAEDKRFSIINLIVNPTLNWLKNYIFNLGFLDGFRGFIAGFSAYVYTFLKYIYLWEIEKREKDGLD